ncbi:MAG: DUF3365 domain-containing protein [Deltaproteobacteria bacterium]|nr:DUF3365 domain-containing protein [Deltaproteobacteria bacterium]
MNRKFIMLAVLAGFSLAFFPAGFSAADDKESLKKDAVKIVKQFAEELTGKMQAAMKQGGPPKAIEVCSRDAQDTASRLSRENGQVVRRVSLKLRNHADAPDAWEQNVLKEFDSQVKSGKNAQDLAKAEIVSEPEGRFFRFMKAIPTAELCLACHGKSIDPTVKSALSENYPHDNAQGYEAGMVRGAFSIKRKL